MSLLRCVVEFRVGGGDVFWLVVYFVCGLVWGFSVWRLRFLEKKGLGIGRCVRCFYVFFIKKIFVSNSYVDGVIFILEMGD